MPWADSAARPIGDEWDHIHAAGGGRDERRGENRRLRRLPAARLNSRGLKDGERRGPTSRGRGPTPGNCPAACPGSPPPEDRRAVTARAGSEPRSHGGGGEPMHAGNEMGGADRPARGRNVEGRGRLGLFSPPEDTDAEGLPSAGVTARRSSGAGVLGMPNADRRMPNECGETREPADAGDHPADADV